MGRRGVRLFDRWRQDLEAVRYGYPGRQYILHWRHDRRKHDAKLHLGARRGLSALLHTEWRRDLERDHAAWSHQLEEFRLGLLSHGPHRHRRPGPGKYVLFV